MSDEYLSKVTSVDLKGSELITRLRAEFSKLHADILSGLVSLSTAASIVNLMTMDDCVGVVTCLLQFSQLVGANDELMEKAIERLAQVLQIGLSVGVVHSNIGSTRCNTCMCIVSTSGWLNVNKLIQCKYTYMYNLIQRHVFLLF